MFGGWPWELDDIPARYLRVLTNYYLVVKNPEESDDEPGSTTVVE